MKKSISFAAPGLRALSVVMGITVLWLIAAITARSAEDDAAAGRAAFERGDYAQAMSEWQGAADHGNAEAQFGLGSLYELGAGDLKQDYKRADYWYQKAAAQGSTEAEYRLALIWAAGGDDFPTDLPEAYKWATLAAASQGVWGSLAGDLKAQLDRVTSSSQQTEGRQRAAAWTEARRAEKEKPAVPVAAAPTAAPPAAAASKQGTGGCPGWPFPTLPCTEQFPPLPGTAAAPSATAPTGPAPSRPPPAKPPIDELNQALTQIACASLQARGSGQGSAIISGAVPNADDRAMIVQLAARYFPNARPDIKLDVVPPPLCRSLADFRAMQLAGLTTEGDLGVRLDNGTNQLREGDPIRIEVRSPAYPVSLRIDYFSVGGEVLHLWPTGNEPTPRLAAGTRYVFGDPANGKVVNAGGPPFGTELITVLATPAALALGSRPVVEKTDEYLRDLKSALGRSNAAPATPNVLATLLVKTGP